MLKNELTLTIIINNKTNNLQTYKKAINNAKNKKWTKVMQKKINNLKA